MPEIARFYGIIIRMYLIDSEHPPPQELIEMWETQNFHSIAPLE